MGFFECVLEEERMLGEHSLRKTRLETDHYRAENERLSIENERLALENERMKIELVRAGLRPGSVRAKARPRAYPELTASAKPKRLGNSIPSELLEYEEDEDDWLDRPPIYMT